MHQMDIEGTQVTFGINTEGNAIAHFYVGVSVKVMVCGNVFRVATPGDGSGNLTLTIEAIKVLSVLAEMKAENNFPPVPEHERIVHKLMEWIINNPGSPRSNALVAEAEAFLRKSRAERKLN